MNSCLKTDIDHQKTFVNIINKRKWKNGYLNYLVKALIDTNKVKWCYVDKLSEKEAKEIICFID